MTTVIRVTAGQRLRDTSPKGLAQAIQTKAGGKVDMHAIYRPSGRGQNHHGVLSEDRYRKQTYIKDLEEFRHGSPRPLRPTDQPGYFERCPLLPHVPI